jgi:hypothetical protein
VVSEICEGCLPEIKATMKSVFNDSLGGFFKLKFTFNGGHAKLHQETLHLIRFTVHNYDKIISLHKQLQEETLSD